MYIYVCVKICVEVEDIKRWDLFLFFLVHQTIAFGHLSSWITQPPQPGPLGRRKRLNVVAILLNASIPSIAFAMSGWVCLASSYGNEPSIVKDISIEIC